jgi:hypothetical protein
MANPNGAINNLVPVRSEEEARELGRKGGINSGITRRKNAIIRNSLKRILNSGFKLPTEINDKDIENYVKKLKNVGVDTKNLELVDLINLGQVLGAIGGKPECYRALLESSGELLETNEEQAPTPSLEITIKDNSKLEGKLYEANKH